MTYWIVAASSAYGLELITSDKDVNHLEKEFLSLKYIDLIKYGK